MSCGFLILLILAYGADILGEVGFHPSAKLRQVQVAVDAAELMAGLEHPGGAPTQNHRPIATT